MLEEVCTEEEKVKVCTPSAFLYLQAVLCEMVNFIKRYITA